MDASHGSEPEPDVELTSNRLLTDPRPFAGGAAEQPSVPPSGSLAADRLVDLDDPWDLDSLRVPVPQALDGPPDALVVRVSKPRRDEWISTSSNADHRLVTIVLVVGRDFFIVAPALRDLLTIEPCCKHIEFALYVSAAQVIGLWPLRLPDVAGRLDDWGASERRAALEAQGQWRRVIAAVDAGCYRVEAPRNPDFLPSPQFPAKPMGELVRLAFGEGGLIDSLDHPVLKKLQGRA